MTPVSERMGEAPLIGREVELERLSTLTSAGGWGSVLVVRGEPGIGKSALLKVAERSANGMTVLRTRGVDLEAGLPFAGLFDLFRPIFGLMEQLPHAQRRALEGALGFGDPVSVDRFAISTGTLALLSAAAEQRPVLVIVDDAQWLDAASLEGLLFACRRLTMDPVSFLWALRDGSSSEPMFAGFDELRPGAFDENAAGRLVFQQRGCQVPPSVLRYLVTASGGNPLTLVESVRAMSDAQLEGREPVPRSLPVGMSAVEIFRRRINDLDSDAVRVLTLLAVANLGDSAVVRRAAALLDIDYLVALEKLEIAALVRIELGVASLSHPLVRAALEGSVDPPELRVAHQALAEALVGRPDPTARAWHLAASATQPDDKVADLLEQAAVHAQRRSAHGVAADAFERAAGLTLRDEPHARRLLYAAQEARLAGGPVNVRRLLEQAADLATSPILQACVESERGLSELYHGASRTAQNLLERAAQRVETVEPAAAAAMLGQAAFAAVLTGDPLRAAVLAKRARALCPGRAEPVVELTLGLALLQQGDPDSLPVLRQAADLTESRRGEVDPDYLAFAALALAWVGEFDRSRALLSRSLPQARAESSFGALCSLLYAAGYLEARTGNLVQAYALAVEGLDVAEASANDLWRYLSLCCLAYVEAARADEAMCRRHADMALELVRRLDIDYPATILDALGLLELGLGHYEQAIAYLVPANVPAGGTEPTLGRLSAPDLVEAYIRAGQELSPSMRAQLDAAAERSRYPAGAAAAERCRGLAAPEGQLDAHFTRALELHAHVSDPFALARTQACYGERLRRVGRRREAREQLMRARAAFERLGAGHWATRVNTELAALGERSHAAGPAGLSQLTPQELQVALKVSEGLSNRQAAAELYVSPKTIEFHLHQIFQKLGLCSRSQLAALVTRLDTAAPTPSGK